MAILKHLNVHNANYHDAVTYLLFQHDEHARPVRNERGKMVLRENVLIDAINTDVWSYALDCNETNQRWKKNRSTREVKSHHFILSFPKEDADQHGLTPELAQQMGMDFARKHFGGHQCIVATHDDGSQHSGNIHVHVCFNSVRAIEMPPPEYSDLERDYKAGFKFQCSDQCMDYLKRNLETMCREHGLSQIPLTKNAAKKVTNKEYWAQKRGQKQQPEGQSFKTDLEKIRSAIDDVRCTASNEREFKELLQEQHGITIRDMRGRWSYVTVGRKNGVTARRLGADYSKEAVLEFIENQHRQIKNHEITRPTAKPEKPMHKPPRLAESQDEPLLIYLFHQTYDLSQPQYQNNIGLERWAKLQNNFIMENRAIGVEKLQKKLKSYEQKITQLEGALTKTEQRIKDINILLRLEGQASSNKKIYQEYAALKLPWKKKSFYTQHQKEIEAYKSALDGLSKYRQKHHVEGKFPGPNRLKAEKRTLLDQRSEYIVQLNELQNTYALLKAASEEVLEACQLNRLLTSDEYFQLTGRKMSPKKRLALDQERQRRQQEREPQQQEEHRRHSRGGYEL